MCIFCSKKFPLEYQLIKEFDDWYFVADINPMRDFHCLLVSKNHYSWFEEINNINTLKNFWNILKICILAIKNSNKNIINISILSLNLWEKSKHLHFHLIPIFCNDSIKSINDISIDCSWIHFLWNHEIIQDSYKIYIENIFWTLSDDILKDIENKLKEKIIQNVKILKNNINYE